MNLARHYKILGLRHSATAGEVKAAYRQLVRQYHPDINPDAEAIERFIQINGAYTAVLEEIEAAAVRKSQRRGVTIDRLGGIRAQLEKLGLGNFQGQADSAESELIQTGYEEDKNSAGVEVGFREEISDRELEIANERVRSQAVQTVKRPLSVAEETLKHDAYAQLKTLLSQQKFPLAIALIEGLAHRMPTDSEVSQWQAIVYQRWGRRLILQGQPHKARIYLKKALRTDPNNQSLWSEVNRDFWHLASLGHQSLPAF
ncbi:MAG: molecular chaperone DnaJ [Leptolyngbya foveolarum]|uniref:Molecular chaperone DnaJ n=1 Tax=Leptolyngbya foveolarum TaxID=47253 RepID=A0A2W4UKP7_9CYAN|nr:MAG: molecular chaperone DnaJ [Leptolyngbya foveolarum]